MNIVFFGSSDFALPSLEAILEAGYKVSGVVTQPDRKKGRGLGLGGTSVKAFAQRSALPVYQPDWVNSAESLQDLKNLHADLFVVVSYGQLLSEELLRLPRIFCVNLHASLLPRYRGAAPIHRAILNGEEETGATVIKMRHEMDAGEIILQEKTAIGLSESAPELEQRLSKMGAGLLLRALASIKAGTFGLLPQDEKAATFAPKLKKNDGLIDWHRSALQIHNQVRGCLLWPGAFTYRKGKLLKIYKTTLLPDAAVPGKGHTAGEVVAVDKKGITVMAGDAPLLIEELQMEGKRRMSAEEFIAGHCLCFGERLSGKK